MEVKSIFELKESSLYASLPLQCKAVLSIERGAFSLCLADAKANKVLAFERWQIDGSGQPVSKQITDIIDWLIMNYPWLSAENVDLTVALHVNKHGLVPQALFEPSHKELYLAMQDPGQEAGDWVYHDNLDVMEAVILYSLPMSVESRIKSAFPKARIIHSKSVLLSAVLKHANEPLPKDLAVVYANQGILEMVVITDGNLMFINEFHWETRDDLAYYILTALEECSLPAAGCSLKMMGPAWIDESLVLYLQQFIPSLAPFEIPEHFTFSNVFGKLPKHALYPFITVLS